MYVKRSTKAALKVKRHVLSCCVSLFVRFSLCSVWYVNSVLISLSCSPLVRPSGAETHSAVFVMLTCRATQAQKCIHATHTVTYTYTCRWRTAKTAERAEADYKSGWQAASHWVMLTFSPIALSLLTLHAPPCCSDLIGLELTVRPGGQDDCVSAHGAHLISVGSP